LEETVGSGYTESNWISSFSLVTQILSWTLEIAVDFAEFSWGFCLNLELSHRLSRENLFMNSKFVPLDYLLGMSLAIFENFRCF